MDGINAIGTTFDASYSMTYASFAGAATSDAALADGAGAPAGDTADISGAYQSPNALMDMLGGAMDDQTLGMIIALLVLSALLGEDQGGGMEDIMAMLGQAMGGGQGAQGGQGEGGMMAMQSMTLSFSYESISIGQDVPLYDSYGGTDMLA